MSKTICTLVLIFALGAEARSSFEVSHNSDKWDMAGYAMLNQDNNRRLAGKPGTGILINGKEGKCPSLVTKRRDYRDVEVHVEVPYACGTNLDLKQYPQGPIIIQGDYGPIAVRKLIPEIPGFGDIEQFNLRSRGGIQNDKNEFDNNTGQKS